MVEGKREIVGRTAELAEIEAFLTADADERQAALLLEGDAGIGKTRLWAAGVEEARRLGYTILMSRPAESEAALPFAGLGDLVGWVPDALVAELPELQRVALEVALSRRPAEQAASDRLACSRAVLAIFRRLCAAGPTLLAIDDLQWLDSPTVDVCEFVVRRVDDPAFRMLLSQRGDEDPARPLDLGDDWLRRISLAPLSSEELGRLLDASLSLRLARPRVLELHRLTGGNPYFALEVGRALLRQGAAEDSPLPVPDSIAGLLRLRLDRLSTDAREATLMCAASVHPSWVLIEQVTGSADGLAEAVNEGVLELDGQRLRWSHPLLAAVAYERAPPWERRNAHRRLAAIVSEVEERARHLSIATRKPDAGVARELEAAAQVAARRGAPAAAANLAESAARLTPRSSATEQRRRLRDAAEYWIAAGNPDRRRQLLEGLVSALPPGPERADLLCRLADPVGDDLARSIRLCEQALEEAGGDPAIRAKAHTGLGMVTWMGGDLEQSAAHLRSAAELAELTGDELLIAISIGELCHALVVLGQPYSHELMERALELERHIDSFPPYMRPSLQLGIMLLYTDELEAARPLLEGELRRTIESGDESSQIGVLFRLAELELRAGSWAEAADLARRSRALSLNAGVEQEQAVGQMIFALVQAHVGLTDEAREAAQAALQIARAEGDRPVEIRAAGVIGFCDLSVGQPAAALEWLTPARARLQAQGIGELSIYGVVQNEIEALVAMDRLDEAELAIAYVEEKGSPTKRTWHAAIAGRGRALVAAARSNLDGARESLAIALSAHARLPQPFELGRTLLVQGSIERRARRWAVAREALTRALDVFDSLGAPLWSEKAAAELARLPGRPRGSGELTEAEQRVGELVAGGLSNKEVAARLFITVRTVEATLSRTYAKLGIRSRTELANRLRTNNGR